MFVRSNRTTVGLNRQGCNRRQSRQCCARCDLQVRPSTVRCKMKLKAAPAHSAAAAHHATCILAPGLRIDNFAAKNSAHFIICLELGRIHAKQGRLVMPGLADASATGRRFGS